MGGRQIFEDAAPRTHENPPATQEQANHPQIWSGSVRIFCVPGSGDLEFSFDGTNIHGRVADGQSEIFLARREAGISIRGVGASTPDFHVEAW